MTRIGFTTSLQELRDATLALASMVDKAVSRSIDAFETWDPIQAATIVDGDDKINDARWSVEEGAVLLIARQAPMATDLREVISIIHTSTELERIGDYAKVVARSVIDTPERPNVEAVPSIIQLGNLGRSQLHDGIEAFVENSPALARRVAKNDAKLDLLWTRIYRQLVAEMIANPLLVNDASGLLWIAHNFERMGDRVTNVCERIVYAATGQFEENVHLAPVEHSPRD